MFDYETKSLWTVISGESISGVNEGKNLNEIKSSQKISWGEWKHLHPNTRVLTYNGKQTTGYDNYRDYHKSRAKTGIHTVKNKDNRLRPKTTVIGLTINQEKKAYSLDSFKNNKLITDVFQDIPLLLFHDKKTNNTVVYNRTIDDKILEFKEQKSSHFIRNNNCLATDKLTGTKWELSTGMAISGKLEGKSLQKIDFKKVYWFIWADYYPKSKIYK